MEDGDNDTLGKTPWRLGLGHLGWTIIEELAEKVVFIDR